MQTIAYVRDGQPGTAAVLVAGLSEAEDRIGSFKAFSINDSLSATVLVTKALTDKDRSVRLAAIDALGSSERQEAVEGLVQIATNLGQDEMLAGHAVDALAKTKSDARLQVLVDIYSRSESFGEKINAAQGLVAAGWGKDIAKCLIADVITPQYSEKLSGLPRGAAGLLSRIYQSDPLPEVVDGMRTALASPNRASVDAGLDFVERTSCRELVPQLLSIALSESGPFYSRDQARYLLETLDRNYSEPKSIKGQLLGLERRLADEE
jgi:hypothetical protein